MFNKFKSRAIEKKTITTTERTATDDISLFTNAFRASLVDVSSIEKPTGFCEFPSFRFESRDK